MTDGAVFDSGGVARRGMAKLTLAAMTLLCLSSMGGLFLAAPALLPLHWWAARRSTIVGRVGWGLLAGLGMAMTAWAAVYSLTGETQPVIWLIPLVVLAGVIDVFVRRATPLEGVPRPLFDADALAVLRRPDGRFTTPVRLLIASLAVGVTAAAFALGTRLGP